MNYYSILEKLILKENLSSEEAYGVMKDVLSGNVPPTVVSGILTALRSKGENEKELVGFIQAMRESMNRVTANSDVVVDTCGTGGDAKGTFNISTAAAFVIAGAGISVAKHGNRSVTSNCGSADLLEAAGVKIDMKREIAEKCLNEIGITFLFAPLYHPSMKNVAPVRKELGIRTVFNILGPMVNPAMANVQLIGVPKKEFVPLISKVLLLLNKERRYSATIINESGYDELVLLGKAEVNEINRNKIQKYTLSAQDFGLKKSQKDNLKGYDAKENARLLRELISEKDHPLNNVVVANAAIAICSAEQMKFPGKAKSSIKNQRLDAVSKAKEAVESGSALKKLDQLIEWSNKN